MKKITPSIRSFTILILCLILGMSSFSFRAFGQALLLPSPSTFSRGTGDCSDIAVGIANENWRVKKGDVFEVWAVRRIDEDSELNFAWSVANGQIVSGQGTSRIQVRAGGTKTPGYINVGGFVAIRLVVERKSKPGCAVETSASVMVGKHRERNQFANVSDLILDENELVIPCEPGYRPSEGHHTSADLIIEVATVAADRENDVLSYAYAVSGGKISGRGSKVKWDLSGVAPGTYTIQAGVDDGFGILGKTIKKAITVQDCGACGGHVECPNITLLGPDSIGSRDEFVVTAQITGGSFSVYSYTWTVTNGTIIDGQETPSITVKGPWSASDPDPVVTLKVSVMEGSTCLDSVSITVPKNP